MSRTSFLATTLVALTLSITPFASAITSSAPAQAPTTRFDVSDLETGPPPALAWSEKRSGRTVIHGVDGTTTPVPNRISELAPMGSGFVIQTYGSRPATTRWVDADGSFGRRTWSTGYGMAVSAKGQAVAFSGKRGKVWTIDSEGDRVLRLPSVPIKGKGQAVALFGEDCQESTTSNGCGVYVNGARAFHTSSHGLVDRVPKIRLTSTARGRWLGGITSVSDFGTCSVMMRNLRARWRTCANRFSDISPDNRLVLGLPSYGDGFGPVTLDILRTSDGSVMRAFKAVRDGRTATYFDEVWEDADHVLVVAYQEDEWSIVRLGVDGSMEYAVAPRTGSDLNNPFQLQTR